MRKREAKHRRPWVDPRPLLFLAALAALAAAPARGQEPEAGAGRVEPADSSATADDSASAAAAGGWDLEGDDGKRPAVRYQGKSIDYLVDRDLIVLSGAARVSYKDIRIEGDSISLDTRRQVLAVSRHPVLYDKEDAIYGDRMVYNFRTRRGWIYNGFTKFERGRYWGRRIRQAGERTLNVDYGRYTTCDAEEPHYYFWARRMKLYLDDKLVAQPVAICFSGIPVLAVPFWILPLRHDRHSGFLMPRFGSSAYEGVYVKNLAYYQVIDERSDLTVSGDYLEFIGWRGNLEGRFASGDRISAQGNFSYLEDRRQLQRRWSLNADYGHRLGRNTRATGRADFLSDTRYRTDFSDDLSSRLDRNLRSYLALNHSWPTGGLAAAADHSHNLDLKTRSTRLPEVSANLYRLDLPGRLAGVSGNSYFINTGTSGPDYQERRQGWDNSADVSASLRLLRHITVSPRTSFRATWYDRDTSGARNQFRWLYSGGVSAQTTLYGILPLRAGPLMGLRHVVQPSLAFSYAPKIDQGRFPAFGAIGRMGEQKSLGLTLGNTFQAKFRRGEESAKIDLMSLSFSAGYNYLAAARKWSGLSTAAAVLPGNRYFDLRLSSYYDVYRRQSEYTNLDASFRLSGVFGRARIAKNGSPQQAGDEPGRAAADTAGVGERTESMAADSAKANVSNSGAVSDSPASERDTTGMKTPASDAGMEGLPWNLSLGLSQGWRTGQGVAQSLVRGSAEANITRNWKASYSQYYDLRLREMVSQEYSIYRDLHCWEARFSSTRSGIYWFYEFRISLKAIPELKLQLPKSGRAAY